MKLLITVLFSCLFAIQAFAEAQVLEIAEDHKVYFRYNQAEAGKPTVVLVNGLIYAVENWDEYYNELVKAGVGVVQVAYSTQPESLRQMEGETPFYAKWTFKPFYGPGPVQQGIETQDLVDETMAVVDSLKIDRFHLVSLSYGSIVASMLASQQIDRVQTTIFMAPAVVTSGRYNPWGATRHEMYSAMKLNPLAATDYLYDTEIGNVLSWLVTRNKYSFDGVVFEDFYSGVYQMARSSKWFDLKDYADVEMPATFLFLATLEDAPLYEDQLAFWDKMKDNVARRSLVTFEGSYHAIPGVAPEAAAEKTLEAIQGKLPFQSSIKVGTGNPPKTTRESLLDFTGLTQDSWLVKKQ